MKEQLTGIDLARSRLVSEVVMVRGDGAVITADEYLNKIYGCGGYFRETTRTVIMSGALQGSWDREGSLRQLDEIDESVALERAFLEGDREKVLRLKR